MQSVSNLRWKGVSVCTQPGRHDPKLIAKRFVDLRSNLSAGASCQRHYNRLFQKDEKMEEAKSP